MIGGKPLYEHLTETALNVASIDDLFVNSDSELAIGIAREKFTNKLRYHLRPPHLGTSAAKLDDYVYEFMRNFQSEYTIFLNPCSLFLRKKTIENAIRYVVANNIDSCVSSKEEKTHAFIENKAINFSFATPQPRSQDLQGVHLMTSGFFIWRNELFLEHYERQGFANFAGKFHSFAVPDLEAVDIDTEEDFRFAERVMSGNRFGPTAQYPAQLSQLIASGKLKPN